MSNDITSLICEEGWIESLLKDEETPKEDFEFETHNFVLLDELAKELQEHISRVTTKEKYDNAITSFKKLLASVYDIQSGIPDFKFTLFGMKAGYHKVSQGQFIIRMQAQYIIEFFPKEEIPSGYLPEIRTKYLDFEDKEPAKQPKITLRLGESHGKYIFDISANKNMKCTLHFFGYKITLFVCTPPSFLRRSKRKRTEFND